MSRPTASTLFFRWFVGTPLLWVCGWNIAEHFKPVHGPHVLKIALVSGVVGAVVCLATFVAEEWER